MAAVKGKILELPSYQTQTTLTALLVAANIDASKFLDAITIAQELPNQKAKVIVFYYE